MNVIQLKFVGFLFTLLALVGILSFGKDLPFAEMVIGGLIATLAAEVRDLYRRETNADMDNSTGNRIVDTGNEIHKR